MDVSIFAIFHNLLSYVGASSSCHWSKSACMPQWYASVNLAALLASPLANVPIEPEVCTLWFGAQMLSLSILMVILETVLSVRVYALYLKSRNIGVLLVIMLTAGIGIAAIYGTRSVLAVHFDGNCVGLKTPHEVLYFRWECLEIISWNWSLLTGPDSSLCSTFILMRYGFLWMLTIHRRNTGRLVNSGRAPIVHLMLRDGAWIFGVVGVTIAALTPPAIVIHSTAHVLFPLPMSFVSIHTCRLILNMQ
ncbi:hypothetical protein FPV67DRAFT_633601 [Lyophyllum atratum]|nr:hypothetical protein FPV67DRAFT_633601 [Lyophyllum atratum]